MAIGSAAASAMDRMLLKCSAFPKDSFFRARRVLRCGSIRLASGVGAGAVSDASSTVSR